MNNQKGELVSIVLPVYNGEKYIALSIESCLQQTHKNIELIIVNDCSTDATSKIINQYAQNDFRIRVIDNIENKKLPASLNIGHRQAKGNFITWTSDDNIYELNAIEVMLNQIFEKKADVAYCDFFLIDNNGDKIREVKLLEIENMIFGNFIACCFLYKKEVFVRNVEYNENLYLAEDYDFWLRAILHSRYTQINRALYYYRKHEDSLTNQISANREKKELWERSVTAMYRNFCKEIYGSDHEVISEWLIKNLQSKKIDFTSLISGSKEINDFKLALKKNINFKRDKLLEKVFLNKYVEAMISEQSAKKYLSKSIFIVKKYVLVLDLNTIKTLVKYSFFK